MIYIVPKLYDCLSFKNSWSGLFDYFKFRSFSIKLRPNQTAANWSYTGTAAAGTPELAGSQGCDLYWTASDYDGPATPSFNQVQNHTDSKNHSVFKAATYRWVPRFLIQASGYVGTTASIIRKANKEWFGTIANVNLEFYGLYIMIPSTVAGSGTGQPAWSFTPETEWVVSCRGRVQ